MPSHDDATGTHGAALFPFLPVPFQAIQVRGRDPHHASPRWAFQLPTMGSMFLDMTVLAPGEENSAELQKTSVWASEGMLVVICLAPHSPRPLTRLTPAPGNAKCAGSTE